VGLPSAKTAEEAEAAAALKLRIKAHYDGCSPHYLALWGEHIHHGLWRPGKEHLSKEDAQVVLVDEMLAAARLAPRSKVLDVGCGVGGTSCKLAGLGHAVTGVSLSPVQVKMAQDNAAAKGVGVRFLEMDGEQLSFPGEDGTFDAVWISEALSHFPRKDRFFGHAMRLLKPGGKVVIVDWFKADAIGRALEDGVVAEIEVGMLLPPLHTVTGYCNLLVAAGGRPIFMDDVSKECAKTWDICLDMLAKPELWGLAASMGTDFVAFLKSFHAMKDGFRTGAFRFTILFVFLGCATARPSRTRARRKRVFASAHPRTPFSHRQDWGKAFRGAGCVALIALLLINFFRMRLTRWLPELVRGGGGGWFCKKAKPK
jgi:tocopherol O-methyltransferase